MNEPERSELERLKQRRPGLAQDMKRCEYCGKDSPDGVVYCPGCGTSFAPAARVDLRRAFRHAWTREDIPFGMRFWLLAWAWAIFFLAAFFPHFTWSWAEYSLILPQSVCYLLVCTMMGQGEHFGAFATVYVLDLGLPLGLTLWCLLENRRVKYFKVYAALCAIFAVNVFAFRIGFPR